MEVGILSSGCSYGIGASSSTTCLEMVLLCVYKLVVPFENVATCGSRFRGSSWCISEHGVIPKHRNVWRGVIHDFSQGTGEFCLQFTWEGSKGNVGYTTWD